MMRPWPAPCWRRPVCERALVAGTQGLFSDLVRDYCQVYEGLEEQRRRFDHEGAVSYSSIRDLLGEAMRKGVFWRLKDTAHHLFRNSQSQTPDKDAILLWQYSGSRHPDGLVSQQPVEALIDWCVGYAFHECAKLREDAFQRQHYANRLAQLGRHQGVTAELYDPLRRLGEQTAESSARELQRILHVLRHGLFLLLRYLEGQEDNTHLARWLVMEEARARAVFADLYDDLLSALYGSRPQRLYMLAAWDLLEAGRSEEARCMLECAARMGRLDAESLTLLRQLEQLQEEGR